MPIHPPKPKQVTTAILVVVLLLVLIPATRQTVFQGHLFQTIDSTAVEYVDEGLVRAGTAFALARTFNAIVSVFQESQLQLEPGGVGVSLALGAALDPANDLVERFSWVMLASLTALGVQKILIEITPFISVQVVLLLALVCLLVGQWRPTLGPVDCLRVGRVLLFAAIVIRLAVPAIALLNNQVYLAFLEPRYDRSVASLERTVTVLEKQQIAATTTETAAEPAEAAEEQGWWGKAFSALGRTVDQGAKMLDLRQRLEAIKLATLDLIDRIVELIVVFVVSTILLPLIFLWGFLKLGRLLIGRGFGPFENRRPLPGSST